ncbi:MAG: PKD-like family lipoprotein [Odoribacter splanchnicus]
MRQILYICMGIILLSIVSCYDDKGNYDYHDINEVTFGDIETVHKVLLNIDTLKINSGDFVEMSHGDLTDTERFEYLWVVFSPSNSNVKDTISTDRILHYPVTLAPGSYNLYLKIRDRVTEVQWKKQFTVTVGTPYSRGILLIGEDTNGNADAQMISMAGIDTLIIKDILKNSGLPALQGPIAFLHTGNQSENYRQIWILSESGSYYLDRETLWGSEDAVFNNFLSSSFAKPMVPIVIAPEQCDINGKVEGQRVVVCQDGSLFYTYLMLSSGRFSYSLNSLQNEPDRFIPASKYIFYGIQSFNNFIWYSEETDRFYTIDNMLSYCSDTIVQKPTDAFPWDQKGTGRKLIYGENTWNEAQPWVCDGNSFALMGDGTNAFIYKFYAKDRKAKAMYEIASNVASDILTADFYAFSSTRSVLFYVKNNVLYAYNYDKGNERVETIPLETTDQITMLKFDLTMEPMKDALFIATYNTAEGGTLRKYYVGNNPDKVELKAGPTAVWTDLTKVKNMSWRAVL